MKSLKTILKLVTFLTVAMSASQTFAKAQTFLACSSNYTGSHDVKIENGYVFFLSAARGFVKTLPLADKLALQSQDPITSVDFAIPVDKCEMNDHAGLSCSDHGVLMSFHGENSATLNLQAQSLVIHTGVLGAGVDSLQMINFDVELADRPSVSDSHSYKSQYQGEPVNNYQLCGRAIN